MARTLRGRNLSSAEASEMGKKSGESRRRKADLRRAMNTILTGNKTTINGIEMTYEEALCFRMVAEALQNGNVGAFRAIMDTIGQTAKSDLDIKEQEAKIRKMEAEAEAARRIADIDEAEDDGFLDALKGTAADDWSDGDA